MPWFSNADARAAAALRRHGYTTVELPANHPAQALVASLPDYFTSVAPQERRRTPRDVLASGDAARGLLQVDGDKQVFIVRDKHALPGGLPIDAGWAAMHALTLRWLGIVERDCGWPAGTLESFVQSVPALPDAPVESLMRLFRYAPQDDDQGVCRLRPHLDRGLLTLVLSDVPGLRVLDQRTKKWNMQPAYGRGPLLSVFVGETLQYLSNGRYHACLHGVQSGLQPRHAVLFQMRPDSAVFVDSDRLTTRATGAYAPPLHERMSDYEERHFADRPSVNYTE